MEMSKIKKMLDEIGIKYSYVEKKYLKKLKDNKYFVGPGAILIDILPKYNIFIFETELVIAYSYKKNGENDMTTISIDISNFNEFKLALSLRDITKFILITNENMINTIVVKVRDEKDNEKSVLEKFNSKIIN